MKTAQDALPAEGKVVAIDLGKGARAVVRLARLETKRGALWWVSCDDKTPIEIEEPRVANRLASGDVWRWRNVVKTKRSPG